MITTTVTPEYTGVLFLGRKGEENARQFIFDVKDWVSDFNIPSDDGYEIRLLVKRPRERTAYPATLLHEGFFTWVWKPQSADFAKAGEGEIELQFVMAEDTVMKSAVIRTKSEGCIGDSEGPVPEDQPGWFQQVLDSTEEVQASAEQVLAVAETVAPNAARAEEAAKRAEEAADSAESGVFVAEYGKTPNAELTEAWEAGKYIVCKDNEFSGSVYPLCHVMSDGTYFTFNIPDIDGIAYCSSNSSGWNKGTFAYDYSNITPESIGAISAGGESISSPETNIDDLRLTKCYLCGSTVIKNGLKGDLPWKSSFLLKVEDFYGDGSRVVQTAYKNHTTNTGRQWRLWNGHEWSAWQDGKGDPGHTPVRGKDYWTPTDIAEIKGYVDEAILGGAW
jgi:hypothetical protein